MRVQFTVLGAVILLSLTAQASTIEDTTTQVHPDLTYQNDAGRPGDAPDVCADVDTDRRVVVDGEHTDSMFVYVDDESDVLWSDTSLDAGDRLGIQVASADALDVQIAMDVLAPDCSFSVFDEDAPPYQPINPQPGPGEKLVTADLSKECTADKDYWKFHVSDGAPSEIFIEWTNGEWERQSFIDNNGGLGNHITTANTEYDIRVAEAVVPDDWDSNFVLLQRPCDTVDGGADPVERVVPAPTKNGLYGEWDARLEGYIVHVYIAETLDEHAAGVVEDTLGLVTDPPTSIAASCDDSLCAGFKGFNTEIFNLAG